MALTGLLCNAFVEEIISKVIAAEDIPADTATQLVVVFTLIQQKAPQVFPVSLTVYQLGISIVWCGSHQCINSGSLTAVFSLVIKDTDAPGCIF